jgi:hypothetical protein
MLNAWRDGWRRVRRAPAIAAGVFALTWLTALPLAVILRGQLETHLGASLAAGEAAEGVNYDWWQEFAAQATGLGATFSPSVIGFAAVLDNVSSVLDGRAEIAPISFALALYLAAWAFLSGGIIDRYARQRPTRTYGFFAASGTFFFRFLRLAIVAAIVYGWLFSQVHTWLFDEQFVDLTRNMAEERTAFLLRLAFYVLFGLLVVAANALFDYAKVRLVVEDRRSAVGSVLAALRFIRGHPREVAGLYALNGAAFLALLALWALVAPGAGGTGVSMVSGLLLGQAYVAARLLLKLQFVASEIALFQARLAHASYTAAPAPTWPESPAAETIAFRP